MDQGQYAKVYQHELCLKNVRPSYYTTENMCAGPHRNVTQTLDSISVFPSQGIKCRQNGTQFFRQLPQNGSFPRHHVLAALCANCACSWRQRPAQIQEEHRREVELYFSCIAKCANYICCDPGYSCCTDSQSGCKNLGSIANYGLLTTSLIQAVTATTIVVLTTTATLLA